MIYFNWSWNLNQSLNKKVFICKNLKNWHFHVWVYIFVHCQKNIWEEKIDLCNSTKCYKVTCFPKLENWHVAEGTLYRFHSIHMTNLFDLSSVLITFVFGNSLIKTSFEAQVIKSNWKWKTIFFEDLLALCSNNVILPQYHSFLQKHLLVQI